MSDDKKLESLKSLQREIKIKLSLLAQKNSYEEQKTRHMAELNEMEAQLEQLLNSKAQAEEDLKNKARDYDNAKIGVVEIQKKFDTISSQKDYDALQKALNEAEATEKSALLSKKAKETELLDLTRLVEEKTKEHEEKKLQVEEPDKDINEKCEDIERQIAEIDGRIAEIKGDVIDDDLYKKFLNIAEKKGGDGFVPVNGQVCRGCNMVLPMQFVIDLRLKQANGEIDTCPYCSRMIYYEKLDDNLEKSYYFDDADSSRAASKNASSAVDTSEDEVEDDETTGDFSESEFGL